MSKSAVQTSAVNCLGAPWPEDLSAPFIDQLIGQGVAVVGCTANLTWDDTLESIENFEIVKAIVGEHPQAYILRSAVDLERSENHGKVGVLLGLQNPKALSDSLRLLDAFFDLGLRCLSLAFSENSYYGYVYDRTQSYALVFSGITISLLISAALTSLLIKPWARLRSE